MKIVLDTNVLVSALIKKGKPRNLLFAILRRHELVLSKGILEEFAETAADPKVRKYVSEQDVARLLKDIMNAVKIVRVRSNFKVVEEDPDDDIVLRTCYDGKAKYVVSGDRHLLALRTFRSIRIVTIDEMLKILKKRD